MATLRCLSYAAGRYAFGVSAPAGGLLVLVSTAALVSAGAGLAQQRPSGGMNIPKTWDENALKDWATPLAGINVRPAHLSSAEYYSLPADNLKTWPVYLKGREPEGYWQMLQRAGPQPMIEPKKLRTQADWVEAGRLVFEQMDHLHLRTLDAELIEIVRRGESLVPLPDGTAANARWVPTKDGVALGFPNCANCHRLITPNGIVIPGAPTFAVRSRLTGPPGPNIIGRAQQSQRFVTGGAPVRMGPEPIGMWLYSAFRVPWIKDDIHDNSKQSHNPSMTP